MRADLPPLEILVNGIPYDEHFAPIIEENLRKDEERRRQRQKDEDEARRREEFEAFAAALDEVIPEDDRRRDETLRRLIGFTTPTTDAEKADALREIAERHARRRKAPPTVSIQLAEALRLLRDRWGSDLVLPNDDAGTTDLFIILSLIRRVRPLDRRELMAMSEAMIPDMDPRRRVAQVDRIMTKPYQWTATSIGRHLNLTYDDRKRLKIKAIRCYDLTPAEVADRQKAEQREARRERNGAIPRDEFLRQGEARREAVRASGVSQSKWYKRPKDVRDREVAEAYERLFGSPKPERKDRHEPRGTVRREQYPLKSPFTTNRSSTGNAIEIREGKSVPIRPDPAPDPIPRGPDQPRNNTFGGHKWMN
ncbi:hypothetical protein [Prosthecomicrobium sp. N25]|uniref:hypothetical protein n=1 Tax=Prosthecomicrobium sp. N25 TaxID=3129254 RepID=UPI0030782C42